MPAFTAQTLLTPTECLDRAVLTVEGGTITDISPVAARTLAGGVAPINFGAGLIAPAFVDLHIHGSSGFDVMDDAAKALPAIERALSRHGVANYLPTTVTAAPDKILRALERLADAVECRREAPFSPESAGRARPLGIHLEGPFISHARRGVHPSEHLLPPNVQTFERLWQASRGHIRMMTIAPELDGATEVIAEASRKGVCVSLGHSDADLDATMRGIAAGARHATHTFNAMRPLDHREPGIVGAVLTDSRLSGDIIADGVHLDPAIVKLFARAKGPEQTVLITDATAATGMPEGRYHLGSLEVEVADGKCTAGGRLAGSILTMDQAVRNLARFADCSLPQAVAAASTNPARVLGLPNHGVLAPGAAADFVVLSPTGEVLRTFIAGQECLLVP